MGSLAKTLLMVSLAGFGPLATAASQAGEPLTKMASSMLHAGANNGRAAPSVMHLPANRLDLAPPTLSVATREKEAESFPSAARHGEAQSESQPRFGAIANPVGSQRVPSRAEQLVRNFHRDGLPVAKLFQSENSLVHLGLNQKGKPGLWIVEKIH